MREAAHTHLCKRFNTRARAQTGHRAPGPYLLGGSATFRRDEALPAELLGGLRADERRVHVVDQLGVGEETLILGALGLGLGLGLGLANPNPNTLTLTPNPNPNPNPKALILGALLRLDRPR